MSYHYKQGVNGYLGFTIMHQEQPLAQIGITQGHWYISPLADLKLSLNQMYNILIQFEKFKQEVEQ